jgi:hypothetical protein
MRTTVASTRMPVAKPRPNIFSTGSAPRVNEANTAIITRAAEVMTRAVVVMPVTIDWVLSPEARYSSRTRDSRNTS